MKLTKYVPLTPVDAFFDRCGLGFPSIDRFLGEFGEGNGEREERPALRVPRTNVRETDEAFLVTVEMPGISKKDVEVHVEGDRLIIKGASSQETEEKGLVRREYRSARYERIFAVGNDVDGEKVTAKMEDGVLTVTLPRKVAKVGRQVEIS